MRRKRGLGLQWKQGGMGRLGKAWEVGNSWETQDQSQGAGELAWRNSVQAAALTEEPEAERGIPGEALPDREWLRPVTQTG